MKDCLVVRVINAANACPHRADVWITHQLPGSSLYLGVTDGSQGCEQLQVMHHAHPCHDAPHLQPGNHAAFTPVLHKAMVHSLFCFMKRR